MPTFFCVWDPFWGPEGALAAPKSLKTGYLALITSNAPKKVEQGSKLVEHYRTHPGGYVKTIQNPRKFNWGVPEAPKNGHFCAKKGRFWALMKLLGDTFLGP